MFQYNFEKLEVWKISLEVIRETNTLIKKLPAEEKYVLGNQLRRAALSIALNIAEGWGRNTKKDFARFVSTAIGSTLEVIASLKIAENLNYLQRAELEKLDQLTKELYFKLLKFNNYLKDKS